MNGEPPTQASLLIRLRDLGDEEAWSQFVRLYLPIVFAYLRRRGLQEADAADVAQEVLRSVAVALPGFDYDPTRGSFRGWLMSVTQSRAVAWWNVNKRRPTPITDSALVGWLDQKAISEERAAWEDDFRQSLLALAIERVRVTVQPATWQAFWLTSLQHQPAEQAAEAIGMSIGAVYVARSRVIARLRRAIRELEHQET